MIIVVIFWALKLATRQNNSKTENSKSAMDILKQRYARGELINRSSRKYERTSKFKCGHEQGFGACGCINSIETLMQLTGILDHGLCRCFHVILLATGLLLSMALESALPAKDLAYPSKNPNAYEIARQVYFVNHYHAFANVSLENHPRGVAEVINREPGGKITFLTLERHVNNTYTKGGIRSRELVIFRSGKLKG